MLTFDTTVSNGNVRFFLSQISWNDGLIFSFSLSFRVAVYFIEHFYFTIETK